MSADTGATNACNDQMREALRALPRVDDLLDEPRVAAAQGDAPHNLALAAVRASLDRERARIRSGSTPRTRDELVTAAAEAVAAEARLNLRCSVNATGVVVHTNLGRAPLSKRAAQHVADVASHYSTLEFDVGTGARGSRHDLVAGLLCDLTGAEAAVVVNNNAAAVMLVLSEFARGREAVVSRGELVEIGGSFRIPDIMALSGARMVEVGTTNKTHLFDYERAICDDTAMVLKVHPSNYRVVGFHEEVDAYDLVRLAHERGVLVYEDQGSGSLVDLERAGVGSGEHTPAQALAAGIDLVSCSGDKLLGGTQAGIVLGSAELIARLRKNPLMRALRPDKLTLAGLEAVLRDYIDAEKAWKDVPVLRMLSAQSSCLRERAHGILARCVAMLVERGESVALDEVGERVVCGPCVLKVSADASFTGGGALPTEKIPTYTLRLACLEEGAPDAEVWRMRLIQEPPRPVVTRMNAGELVCDVRTLVDERDEDDLVEALVGLLTDMVHPKDV